MDHSIKPVNVELIAMVCHEANKALCEAFGDMSQTDWEHAQEWQRQSAVNGVIAHLEAGPNGLSPGDTHRSWLKEKKDTGWIWGPTKDADFKVHPCMVPFEELPVEQQAKDYIFGAIVHALRNKT